MTSEELPFSPVLLGRAVSYHMMKNRISAFDLSFRTGLPEERILELEKGKTSKTNIELELIAGAIGRPPVTLLLP